MNDSLRTNLFVRFPPETIACACIFLAARELKVCVFIWLENLPLCLVLPYAGSCIDFRFLCARVLHGGLCLMPSMKTLRYSSFDVSSCSHTSELLFTHVARLVLRLLVAAFGCTVCKHTERRPCRFGITLDTERKHCQRRDL